MAASWLCHTVSNVCWRSLIPCLGWELNCHICLIPTSFLDLGLHVSLCILHVFITQFITQPLLCWFFFFFCACSVSSSGHSSWQEVLKAHVLYYLAGKKTEVFSFPQWLEGGNPSWLFPFLYGTLSILVVNTRVLSFLRQILELKHPLKATGAGIFWPFSSSWRCLFSCRWVPRLWPWTQRSPWMSPLVMLWTSQNELGMSECDAQRQITEEFAQDSGTLSSQLSLPEFRAFLLAAEWAHVTRIPTTTEEPSCQKTTRWWVWTEKGGWGKIKLCLIFYLGCVCKVVLCLNKSKFQELYQCLHFWRLKTCGFMLWEETWSYLIRGSMCASFCMTDSLLSFSKWPKLLVGAHSRKFVFMLWRGLAASEWLLPLPQVPSWILALCVCS